MNTTEQNETLDALDAARERFVPTRPLAERITENGYTPLQFVSYLRHTLIPDFHDAEMHATATDFETALQFICQLADERAELIASLAEALDYIKAGFPEVVEDDETITISADEGPEVTFHYAAASKLLNHLNP